MPDPPFARQFQHVDMPRQVGADIGVRVDQRITHPRLRAQMDDRFDHLIGQRVLHRIHIGKILLVEGEQLAMGGVQPFQPRALQGHGIIVVHIVDADHGMALRHQPVGNRHADKSGRAGDQYRHVPISNRETCLASQPIWRAL